MKKSQVIFVSILLLLAFGLGSYAYAISTRSDTTQKNSYNYSFSELVNYVNNIENYLAKAMISKSSKHSAKTLTKIWNEANLAVVYMENIPFDDKGTSKSIKFLNQVSDYAYTLSRKSINGEELSNDDFDNLNKLYKYSVDLKNTINEMALELNNGTLSWDDLDNTSKLAFADEEDIDIFGSIESNFDDYEGLIYDGAYADFIVKNEKLGLTGDNIDANKAKDKLINIFGKDQVEKIEESEQMVGGNIESYNFNVKLKSRQNPMDIQISKKGGWIISIVENRDVKEEKISEEDAIKKGKDFLNLIGYENMKETYSLKQSNIVTINYAYEENDILMYPDLIKVKIALDDGEVLGIEATGYLNAHTNRANLEVKINSEEAKKFLNDKLEIENERLTVIPLDNNKEVFCYEFKGKVEDREFLVYINAVTGEEEEILVLLETEGGTLTI
ncbi:MAG: germination protein YpeB [Clostridia bacterium]|nr:germination protein YpeB [Clostridia bacterium]